jgi:hypothetical protein
MPIDDIDVRRAANIVVKPHGENAAIVAAPRADELLAQGLQTGREGERGCIHKYVSRGPASA